MMFTQVNVGIGNRNSHIEIQNGIVIIDPNSRNRYTISELWEVLINQFEMKDLEINQQLPQNVLINKTEGKEQFNSSKIISSLMQIGIPFPATVEIVEETISEVERWIAENKRNKTQLTTKIIRQIVSSVIQELDTSKWSRIDIENWNAKYVRRYGHNNRIIQIYDIPPEISVEPVVNISFDFIRKNLISDIIRTLFPDIDVTKEISSKNRCEMADEIIAFINNCDLYMINYRVLKDMITEIATQLPHPWFISEDKRLTNIEHDKKSVQENLRLAYSHYESKEPLSSSIIVELLHHASSMVLERYFSFLGCYDLTAFYRLVYIVTKLTPNHMVEGKNGANNKKDDDPDTIEFDWDIVISDYAFKNFFDDCTIAGVDLLKYREKIKHIANFLQEKNSNKLEFTKLLIEFGEQCLDILNYGDRKEIELFLNKSWAEYSPYSIGKNIKTLLLLLFPHRRHKIANPKSSHFWITYNISTKVFEMKSKVFVVIANRNNDFDYSAVQLLNQAGKKAICNTIFFVAEEMDNIEKVRQEALEQLAHYNLDSHFIPILFSKKDLKALFDSSDRTSFFDDLVEKQLIPENIF